MAWYPITYRCGHEDRIQIYGPVKDRQWKADRSADRLCRDCWLKEREQKNQKDQAANAEAGLPALTGSPKQITWAESIRKRQLAEVKDIQDTYETHGNADNARVVAAAHKALSAVDSAKWWIDTRSFGSATLIPAAHFFPDFKDPAPGVPMSFRPDDEDVDWLKRLTPKT